MLRKVCKVHLVLLCCLLAAGVELRAEVISSLEPAILRMDAFVAARYDANRALVFFASQPVVPGSRRSCGWRRAMPQRNGSIAGRVGRILLRALARHSRWHWAAARRSTER
jgi:hypothetical protein